MIAEVVVDIKNKAVDRVFDYKIPDYLVEVIVPGVRVMVPFGPRALAGFVVCVKEKSDFTGKFRLISKLMDVVPVLNAELLALGIELGRETGATMISCFDAMIPAAMKAKYRKLYVLVPSEKKDAELMELFKNTETLDATVVKDHQLKLLKQAIENGAVEVVYEASAKLGAKTKRYVDLVDAKNLKLTEKQQIAVDQLQASENPIAKADMNVSDAVLKGLADKGVIRYLDVEVYRDPYAETKQLSLPKRQLNEAQQHAVDVVKAAASDIILLHGVTGSGKTEVYLEAIQSVVDAGKEVIVLIPEITLTTQITERFKQRFGNKVAVFHSGLSMGERYDEWRKIHRVEVNIVVGARSAVFAPFTNIGLIIIDEEHEATYKQEEMPRYHAIEVAKKRAQAHGCSVVLGSATPSLEAYARAIKGVYKLVELPERAVQDATKPTVNLIDMNQHVLTPSSGIMSNVLENAITDRLAKKEQIILFLNRRGYANFMQCRECQEVVSCPNCDVTLTYHKQSGVLKCHYCNFTAPVVQTCPKCESSEVRFFGTGTQKIEEFLATKFPKATVQRMDVDATTKKGDHGRIIKAFENRKADILIGTQMVAKGLDFPGVTLVGVIDADTMLHFPDFKAAERTFQILTQVAGRAGRHQSGGEVYIETYSPNHYVMQHVKSQDYKAFYREEMQSRKRYRYSPYFFHAKVLLSSVDPEILMVIGSQVNELLRTELAEECMITGPVMAGIARINNRFRQYFILKYKKAPNLHSTILQMLEHIDHKDVSIAVDYFPVHLI